MGKVILKSVLFFTYFIFSDGAESDNVVKESIYRLCQMKSFILGWAITSTRHIFLLVIIIKFTNVIFVHNITYQLHYYRGQNSFSIQNTGFVYYRQFSIMFMFNTICKLL